MRDRFQGLKAPAYYGLLASFRDMFEVEIIFLGFFVFDDFAVLGAIATVQIYFPMALFLFGLGIDLN